MYGDFDFRVETAWHGSGHTVFREEYRFMSIVDVDGQPLTNAYVAEAEPSTVPDPSTWWSFLGGAVVFLAIKSRLRTRRSC